VPGRPAGRPGTQNCAILKAQIPEPRPHSQKTALPDSRSHAEHGITRRSEIGDAEIVERLLYPLINEGALILEEGIAYRPGDIDIVWTAGYGFPDHRGGPIFMAGTIGLPAIVAALQRHGLQRGDPHGYWRVAPLLERCAREGRRLSP